jgi:hypothetical protein
MSKMNVSGFTAEQSLYNMRRHYHYMAMSDYSKGRREVISQLQGSVFHRARGGGIFGTIEDYQILQTRLPISLLRVCGTLRRSALRQLRRRLPGMPARMFPGHSVRHSDKTLATADNGIYADHFAKGGVSLLRPNNLHTRRDEDVALLRPLKLTN